jgi:hypothetical protein
MGGAKDFAACLQDIEVRIKGFFERSPAGGGAKKSFLSARGFLWAQKSAF